MTATLTFASATARPNTGYPPSTTLSAPATPSLALPGYLTPITDPTWGTTVTRITNTDGVRHEYAKQQEWNADGSLLLEGYPFPGVLLDGNNYSVVDASFHQNANACWSNTDPRKLYGITSAGVLRTMDPLVDQVFTTVHSFGGSSMTIGNGEGTFDDADRFIAIQGVSSGNKVWVYDNLNDLVVATKTFTTLPKYSAMARSGSFLVIAWQTDGAGAEQGAWLFDRNLIAIRQLTTKKRHADLGRDINGADQFVTATDDGLTSYALPSGAETVLLPAGYATIAYISHVSMRCLDRNGWAYISNYDTINGAGENGVDQVFAVKTDGSATVQVFAHMHHVHDGTAPYYAMQAHATPSRDGKRVLFASEWDATAVYDYIASAQ